MTSTSSTAHEWYGLECCSAVDCRELLPDEIEETKNGYLIKTNGWFVPFDSKLIKVSKDGKFHGCFRAANDKGELLCLYVPPPSI
jgi:hypothetical protein